MDNPGFKPLCDANNVRSDLWVIDLICQDKPEWNVERIQENFIEADAKAIRYDPLRFNKPEDRLVWHFTKDGKYTVKSANKIVKMEDECSNDFSSSFGAQSRIWKWICKLSIPPKIQIFIWKCVQRILPTRDALSRIGVKTTRICGRCGDARETIEHVLRDCAWAQFVWSVSPLRIKIEDDMHLWSFSDWLIHVVDNGDKESHPMYAMLLWVLWDARNKLLFQNITSDPSYRILIRKHEIGGASYIMAGRSLARSGEESKTNGQPERRLC
ncbi:hypothetical protein DH2020_029299 [Rehmannia glutinosa]|uniref:Reverse transcriptase zinc-binding domain-containing protein n=1 Tax=Rehmannia glutinosa TaxID=99300 RepID=A0ABR0VPV8_REHGL